MAQWTLTELKSQLQARKELKTWRINTERVGRSERYFLNDGGKLAIDQDREVEAQEFQLQVAVPLANKTNRQGEASLKLNLFTPLAPQIENAIQAALQTDMQAWSLPTQKPELPTQPVLTCDTRIREDRKRVLADFTARIEAAVAKPRGTAVFNSSELFVSVHMRELHLSNGTTHAWEQSRVYLEAAYSAAMKEGGKIISDEYLSTTWGVACEQVDVEKLFTECAENAMHMIQVEKPTTGTYPVILHSDVLNTVLHAYASRLRASSEYMKTPHLKPGQQYISEAKGDLLTITMDPWLKYGAASLLVAGDGCAQKPLVLVENNEVRAQITDKRHGDYLGRPPTTCVGNLVVKTGTHTLEQLKKSAPQVVEILQFSGLFVDELSGTFSSEIRLARLHDNKTGRVHYIKGGSLSGSVVENMRNAKFGSEPAHTTGFEYGDEGHGYSGPSCILFSDVSIVG